MTHNDRDRVTGETHWDQSFDRLSRQMRFRVKSQALAAAINLNFL